MRTPLIALLTLLALPAFAQTEQPASAANLAGVLQYCAQNNELGGTDPSSLQQDLLGRYTKSADNPSADPDFGAGSGGRLTGEDATVTAKQCGQALQDAQSLQ